jgi:hypothetical protein
MDRLQGNVNIVPLLNDIDMLGAGQSLDASAKTLADSLEGGTNVTCDRAGPKV